MVLTRRRAGAQQLAALASRIESVDAILFAILGHLAADDSKALYRAGSINRSWRAASAAADDLWRRICARDLPLLEQLSVVRPGVPMRQLYAQEFLRKQRALTFASDVKPVRAQMPNPADYLLGITLRKLGAVVRKRDPEKQPLHPANQADEREQGEIIFTTLAELSNDYGLALLASVKVTAGNTTRPSCSLRAGTDGDIGSDVHDEWLSFQLVIDCFLLRKTDGKQFPLCAGSSEQVEGSGTSVDSVYSTDGMARRPEVLLHDDPDCTVYMWLIPGTGTGIQGGRGTVTHHQITAARLRAIIDFEIDGDGDFYSRRKTPQFSPDFGTDEDAMNDWEYNHEWWEAAVSGVTLQLIQQDDNRPGFMSDCCDWDYRPEKRITDVRELLQLLDSPYLANQWV